MYSSIIDFGIKFFSEEIQNRDSIEIFPCDFWRLEVDKDILNSKLKKTTWKTCTLIPINVPAHWILAYIKTVLVDKIYNSEIYILDSIQTSNYRKKQLSKRLKAYAKFRGSEQVKTIFTPVQTQANGRDCGVHVILNAKTVLENHHDEATLSQLLTNYDAQNICTDTRGILASAIERLAGISRMKTINRGGQSTAPSS